MLFFTTVLLLAAGAKASLLSLQSPRFTINSASGSQLRSEPLSLTQKPSPALTLGKTDTLKLTFQIVEKEKGTGVQPHQTFLRFYDKSTGEESVQPIRVSSGGKAKYELNMARPSSLPPTSTEPLAVTLIIGSYSHDPLSISLFDLELPASRPAPQHPDEHTFHPLPAIEHTFRAEQKLPLKPISAIFSLAVLAPWIVLLGLWSQISIRVPHLFSINILPFTATLCAFEGLLVWYWVDLKLGQVLLYSAGLAVVATFTGKNALATSANLRLGRK